ncbi:hypothetical protein L9F63_003623 [Diploptera punctata]|uniref:Sec1 family domain-containing protein 2 n=1 Tax=Diploptera punctata TaxID=6984 RepID=A0AAD8E986_DIPPU|nr:hypothetical protein L9F63_003623 [Diploptera punctata]
MVLTLHQFCQVGWREICKKVKKAVVYIDNEAAECLHWNGGLMEMMSAGALTVKEFSSFENGNPDQKKAVFILSSPVHGTTKMILQDLIHNSSFEYCVLITSAHPRVHMFAKFGGHREGIEDMSLFHSLEEEMLEWMGNMNYTVEVIYSPLFIQPLTEMIFLTPPFRDMFPFSEAHIPKILQLQQLQHKAVHMQTHGSLSSIEFATLPLEVQLTIHQLVSCLHSLFVSLEMQEDIYTLGHLSALVAGQLEALPDASNRRKTAANHCSLILIDRTLDLASVTSYNSDSLLDRILAVLPRLPGHTNDVAVNMSPICSAKVSSALENVILPPGCLAQPNYDICPQQALAVTQTLRSPRTAQLEVIVSIEKVLLQNLGSSKTGVGVLAQETWLQLVKTRQRERNLSLADIFGLLIHLFSLAGTDVEFPAVEQSHLVSALTQALSEDRDQLQGNLSKLVELKSEEEYEEIAAEVFSKLRYIASARKNLVRYRSLLSQQGPSQPTAYHSLLHQLMADVLDPARPELPDLTNKSSGLKVILKSGFSLLLNRQKHQHPLDNPLVIVFILGGITAQEVKVIQEMLVSSGQDTKVLIGGTRLLSPSDVVEAIFVKDPLMQDML